jgi:hypothetical protein
MNLTKKDYTIKVDGLIFFSFCMMGITAFLVVLKMCGALKFAWFIILIPVIIPLSILVLIIMVFVAFIVIFGFLAIMGMFL